MDETKFKIEITVNKQVESLVDEEIAKFLDNLEQGYNAEVEVETDGGDDE